MSSSNIDIMNKIYQDSITDSINDIYIDDYCKLYTELYEKKYPKYKFGYINLTINYNKYIDIGIQYKETYIRIKYHKDLSERVFIYNKNNKLKYVEYEKLREYLLFEINNIRTDLFRNVKKNFFIDIIEYWFNKNYANDVFL